MPRTLTPSRLIRRTHLFLALFLTPWVLMYALSTISMHHRLLFTGEERRVDPGYELVSEQRYERAPAEGEDRHAVAERILADLDLEGAFSVRGDLETGPLTIVRDRPIGARRITYDPAAATVRIERQRFGLAFVLEMLHRRRGFQHPFFAHDAWAFIVDSVIVAILLWAATGLWMWWEMLKTRRLGALFLAAGVALFALFLGLL
ncbi:MAG: PepSY-associated TM helix domain-containing protein [Rhodothermales bacterium]